MDKNKLAHSNSKGLQRLKELWPELTLFERFEYVITLIVSLVLALIIVVALLSLLENIYQMVIAQFDGGVDYKMFQITFGMLLTLLIALEFRNSIDAILEGKGLLVQVKIVVLIAIIALARKFLVMDPKEFEPMMIAAFALVTLSLGVVYWLLAKKQTL
ncbi:MAG TPA: diguanylate cyclase [Chromatiales bacterium]|nr:diguanylate cyclase [Chromatiales bacterium]